MAVNCGIHLHSLTFTNWKKAHIFCLKCIQSIPKRSRTVITLSLLGTKPMEYEIDKQKIRGAFNKLCH